MTSVRDLERAFLRIAEHGAAHGKYRAVPILEGPSRGPLAAIDPAGFRHILAEVTTTDVTLVDDRSAGIKVRRQELIDATGSHVYVDVSSGGDSYNDLFTIVADEIITAWAASPNSPDRIAISIVERWRHVFAKSSIGRSLSLNELVGIFGELTVLERLGYRVELWDGPNGGRHDFVSPGVDIEVKATSARAGYVVEVSSLEQLAPSPTGRLFLAFFRLELVPSGGDSISDLVEKAPAAARQAVVERLATLSATGELLDPSPRRLRVLESQTYEVAADFPRLVAADIPRWPVDGIKFLRYGVDLANAAGPISAAAAISVYQEATSRCLP